MIAGRTKTLLAVIALIAAFAVSAQTLYKYRGADGEWIYADKRPDDQDVEETRDIESSDIKGTVEVSHTVVGKSIQIVADNGFFAPIELTINFHVIEGIEYPRPDKPRRWVVPPRSKSILLNLAILDNVEAPNARYAYRYTIGDPEATHKPSSPYRVPYAVARDLRISQAFPDASTHDTPDSYYAVDIAMPIGTDIYAARSGIVFDVTGTNFRSGLDRERDAPAANVIRILHNDGTYGVYAHLNWNSIRVRPGDQVKRGQYIADSGNTGFTSGPHLHFAVVRNAGMLPLSVPVRFEGANSDAVTPATGNVLTAY